MTTPTNDKPEVCPICKVKGDHYRSCPNYAPAPPEATQPTRKEGSASDPSNDAATLLPCPFCGNNPLTMSRTRNNMPARTLFAKCLDCATAWMDEEDWNRRTPDPSATQRGDAAGKTPRNFVNQRFVDRIIARAQNSMMSLGEPKGSNADPYGISNYEPQNLEAVGILLVSSHDAKYDLVSLFVAGMQEVQAEFETELSTALAKLHEIDHHFRNPTLRSYTQ